MDDALIGASLRNVLELVDFLATAEVRMELVGDIDDDVDGSEALFSLGVPKTQEYNSTINSRKKKKTKFVFLTMDQLHTNRFSGFGSLRRFQKIARLHLNSGKSDPIR